MNTEIMDVESSKVDDIHTKSSSRNETNNLVENKKDNSLNDVIENSFTLLKSNDDKSKESVGDSKIKIDDKGGTFENGKETFSLNSNLDPKSLEITLENLENFEVIHGNGEQGIDLEDGNNLNEKESTFSENKKTNNDNNNSNISLTDDNGNNQSKSTEHTAKDACDNDEAGCTKLLSSVKIKTEESLDKNVSDKDEHLGKNSEIIHNNNTNVTDSQPETVTSENNISEQQKNPETTEENSQCDESDIPMIVVKENPKKNLDYRSKNKMLNNLLEDSQLSDNKENKRLRSKRKIVNEKVEALTGLATNDQQEQEEEEQQQQQQPLPEGWKRETVQRSRKNKMDIYYISPTGMRLRCEAEVYQYCEREGLQIDLSLFDFGYDEVDVTGSDTSLTLSSDDDSSDDEVVWASTGMDGQNKTSKEPSAKAKALNPYDIVNSQISKRIYIGRDIVLRPKVIPYKATVNAKHPLPDFLENYTVLRYDDYLAFRTKEMFWQEPFMKCIYKAISERKIRMIDAAEIVGVKYNKLSYEYNEFTNSPWLTEAFTEYLGKQQEASTSQNSQITPIRAASPSEKVLSTSRPGIYTPSAERVTSTNTFVPPNMYSTKDIDNMLKKCNCKKSHCLQASCPCFNNFGQCLNCKCKDCNNTDKDPKREVAMKKRLTKMYPSLSKDLKVSNAAAMAAAVTVEEMMRKGKQLQEAAGINNGATSSKSGNQTNNARPFGCTCRGTCQKNNCGCFSKGLNCSDACLCLNCTNRIMIKSIFNPVKPENNLALHTLPYVTPSGMESITDTIRRLFPQIQVQPQPASLPNTNTINVSKMAVNPGNVSKIAAVIPHTVPSGTPDVVACTVASTVSSVVVPAKQQKTNISSSNAIRGLGDKETFLHKWVEANYKIDGSTVWEENLIFLHLRNTVERLGLGHVITIGQLRESLRKVFGPAVGPNKNLGTSHWVYNGIKPVLAFSSTNKNNNNSTVLATSTSQQPPTTSAPLTVLSNGANVTIQRGKGNNAAQLATSSSTVSVSSTFGVPHSIGNNTQTNDAGPSANINNTGNLDNTSFEESHKILCINAWLKENFKKSPGSISIDSLYQTCLSNLTTTNKVFSISELISCVKSVFGQDVGPVPCTDAKGIIRWNFLGIHSKDATVVSAGPTGTQMATIPSSVMDDSAPNTNNDIPMVRIHSVESLATPSATVLNKQVLTNNESQKLAAINVINWLKENFTRAPGSMDVDSLYQKYLSNLKAPNKEIDVSEFIHCVKIVFGEDIGPNPCYDDKGIIRWHYVGIWSKNDAEISTENGHAGSTTESMIDSDDDVCIIDGDNAMAVDPKIDDHFRRSLGSDYQHLLRKTQNQAQHNIDEGSEEFCPVIEDVYSEPQNSQTSIGGPTGPVGLPALSGPHGVSSGPHGMSRGPLSHAAMANNELAGNVIPPGATMLTNPTGSSVARAVEVGIRVQRGPDWIHGDEDGHGLGSVIELSKNGTVRVIWDCNKHKSTEGEWYNMGLNGKYRLRPADDAPRLTIEAMPSSTLVGPPAPLLVNPSAPSTAVGNFHAPSLGHPSAPMLYNPNGPLIGIPPGLMLGNLHGGSMLNPMHLNPSGPMLLNPFVAAALGNNMSGPAPVNLASPGNVFSSPNPQDIISKASQAAASVSALMPIWTHQRVEVSNIVEPGPNWHLVNDANPDRGSVLEVQVINKKQYAKVQWYKGPTINSIGPSDWGWYCYTTGEIQLCESHSLTKNRSQITHPSGLSRRERKLIKSPRVCNIDAEEVILEWLLTNYTECPGAQLAQVDIYQSCKQYMDSRGMSTKGPIVFGNIMRKIYGTSIGPRRTEIDGDFKWRYQGIISNKEAHFKRGTIQDPMCIEEIEKMVTDSEQTCSSSFEGHNFSPPRSVASFSNHCDSTSGLRNSRSPSPMSRSLSPMSRSPSPLSSLSPASSLEQLSDIDSHDGTNLDLEENMLDDSGCLSDSDVCGTGAVSPTKQKELPTTHHKFPDCPYDPVKDRKMWLLYMDTFSK